MKHRLDLGAFLDESFWKDPEIIGFVRKIVMEVDPEADKHLQHTEGFDYRSSGKVELTLMDGRKIEEANRPVKGLPSGAPAIWQDVVQKFEKNAATVLPSTQVHRIIETVDKLDTLGDVSELAAYLCAK